MRQVPNLWTEEQIHQFLVGAGGTKYFPLYMLLLATGLRLGEALSLQWGDIDLSRRVILVRGGKTVNARRAVLLPDELVRELRAVRGLGPLFPFHHFTVRKAFYALLRRLGLPRIRLHDLRHAHGSALLAGGVDLATVSARLGHSSKAFTLQTYLHSMTSAQERAALVANQLLTNPNGSELRNAASGAGIVERGTGIEPA